VADPLFANLAAGDLHERSTAGRFVDGVGFVMTDTQTSFAVDHANPATAFSNEAAPSGGRANIGAYGNTEHASKGNTNIYFDARTAESGTLMLNEVLSPYPLVWHSHLIPTGATVRLEYSGDNGLTWLGIASNLPSYQEFYIWALSPTYNTYNKGRWRVVMEQSPFTTDINDGRIDMFFGEFAISAVGRTASNLNEIVWRAAWGENYQVQFANRLLTTAPALNWSNAPQGSASNQQANFRSVTGGDLIYEDVGSSPGTGSAHRLYRVVLEQME
jgi:hypothetical protein